MATTFVQGVEAKAGGGGTTSPTATITATQAGDMLVVGTLSFDGSSPQLASDVTLGGVSLTKVAGSDITWTGAFTGVKTNTWRTFNAASGQTAVVGTWPSSVNFREIHVHVARSQPAGIQEDVFQAMAGAPSSGTVSGGGDAAGASITTTKVNGYIFAFAGFGTTFSSNPKAGNNYSTGTGTADASCYRLPTGVETSQAVWSATSGDDYCAYAVSFGEVPAPVFVVDRPRIVQRPAPFLPGGVTRRS